MHRRSFLRSPSTVPKCWLATSMGHPAQQLTATVFNCTAQQNTNSMWSECRSCCRRQRLWLTVAGTQVSLAALDALLLIRSGSYHHWQHLLFQSYITAAVIHACCVLWPHLTHLSDCKLTGCLDCHWFRQHQSSYYNIDLSFVNRLL